MERCDSYKFQLLLPTRTVSALSTVLEGLLNFYRLTTAWLPLAAKMVTVRLLWFSCKLFLPQLRQQYRTKLKLETDRMVAPLLTRRWRHWVKLVACDSNHWTKFLEQIVVKDRANMPSILKLIFKPSSKLKYFNIFGTNNLHPDKHLVLLFTSIHPFFQLKIMMTLQYKWACLCRYYNPLLCSWAQCMIRLDASAQGATLHLSPSRLVITIKNVSSGSAIKSRGHNHQSESPSSWKRTVFQAAVWQIWHGSPAVCSNIQPGNAG